MNWYYLDNAGTQRGPITDADFAPMTQQGVINASTYLWCEGMSEWKMYGELTGAATQPAVVTQPAATGLRVKRDETPQMADAGCTQCGAIVPREQLVVSGASALCPKCVVAKHRSEQFSGAGYASPFLRIIAYLIDGFVVTVVFWVGLLGMKWVLVRTVNDPHTRGVIGVVFMAGLALWVLDYFTGRVARNGATFGQSLFGMKVVTANGAPISFLRALGRFLVMLIVNQITFALGQIVAFFDKQKRCLHDIVCGTVVLKK
jgi:uncharacterized RDD family membrane protein YckC